MKWVLNKLKFIFIYFLFLGGHILSGAVLEPRALNELIPEWSENTDDVNKQQEELGIYTFRNARLKLKQRVIECDF